jgi:hypothetical protein
MPKPSATDVGFFVSVFAGALVAFTAGIALLSPRDDKPGPHPFDSAMLCRATIAVLYVRPVRTVTAEAAGDAVATEYPGDGGKVRKDKCKVSGKNVVYGNADGRWRDDYAAGDSLVSYAADAEGVTVYERYADGSVASHRFALADF